VSLTAASFRSRRTCSIASAQHVLVVRHNLPSGVAGLAAVAGGADAANANPAKVMTQSMIDSWALAYHAAGTVRGADLTNVFNYPSTAPPSVLS
jgi:hypothetical protein